MNVLRYVSVAVVACLTGSIALPEDKPDYAKLLVGKWEVTKADPGTVPEGAIIEFMKDGKLKASINTDTFEGTYTLDGNKIKTKIGDQDKEEITIVKISETEMSTKDKDDKKVVLKRMK